MRLFVIGWDNSDKDYSDVILGLQEKGHEIAYWVSGAEKEKFEVNQEQFPGTIFHHYLDATNDLPPNEFSDTRLDPPGEDLIKDFYETESTILTMLRKQLGCGTSVIEMRHVYYTYLRYWSHVLEKLKPEAVIFAFWPHAGYDYVLYSLAKKAGIKTIMFSFTRISDRILPVNDIKLGSNALKNELKKNKNSKFSLEDMAVDVREAFKKQTGNDEEAVPSDLDSIRNKYSRSLFSEKKLKVILVAILDLSIFKKSFLFLKNKIGSNLRKEYQKLQIVPDLNKKFVYVPLHFQPEASTSPLGGIFVDQILMVEILSAALPADWLIYVKENPFQWLIGGVSFAQFRSPYYYQTLAKLKNVRLVPVETGSFELTRKAQTVASVTGTAGWEAVLRLKPALVFGYAWYNDCPGIFKVNSVESCQKSFDKILNGFGISKQDIINYLVSFDRASCRGYFENEIKRRSAVQGAVLTQNLLLALIKEIEAGPAGKIPTDNLTQTFF